jgi:phenylacetaldehyde dehydrogenase
MPDSCQPGLHLAATAFLSRDLKMLVGGAFRAARSGETIAVLDPSTGARLTNVPAAGPEDVNDAVAAARAAFENVWLYTQPAERARLLWKLADLLERDGEEFAQYEAIDGGKPLRIVRAVDVPVAIDHLRYMGGWATKLYGSTIPFSVPGEHLCYTTREPVGVVGAIIPWNFPLLTAIWKLAPALAAGCTMVLKLAENTPVSALRLAELVMEAGFPPGVLNIITGLGTVAGAALAEHPDLDKITFTGSTAVGRSIIRAAAGNFKRVSLELGGKSPVIIFPDADMDMAIAGAANAIFWNNGQCCTAGSRLYVHRKVHDQVVAGIAAIAGSLRVGNSLDPDTEMGPLISAGQRDRVCGYVYDGIRAGAKLIAGGAPGPGAGYFMQPTVLADARPDMRVVREEIFGPVLCIQPFDDADLEQIVAVANDTEYGLVASIWTRDGALAHRLARRIRSGIVWLNCYFVFDSGMPFGGFKRSGWGREMGEAGLHAFTEVKAVVSQLAAPVF